MAPTAPAEEIRRCCQPDSCHPMARARCDSTPRWRAFRTMTERTLARLASAWRHGFRWWTRWAAGRWTRARWAPARWTRARWTRARWTRARWTRARWTRARRAAATTTGIRIRSPT